MNLSPREIKPDIAGYKWENEDVRSRTSLEVGRTAKPHSLLRYLLGGTMCEMLVLTYGSEDWRSGEHGRKEIHEGCASALTVPP